MTSSAATLARGRYRLERELGRGGMATVWLAHDQELDRPVAVKVLAREVAAEPELRARFLREARVAARLSHPNVVHVFDAGEDGERLYIVMEYVPGESLAHALRRRGRFPADEAVELAIAACAGLAQAHAVGLVHRDVKPANLLLRDDRTLKIADFGIVRSAEETRLTQVGTVLGTAAYLAPEQAAGEPVTAAADVYALGVVVYELLTGRPPRQIESAGDLAALTHGGPIPPIRELAPAVSPALEAAVMRSLARNPAYRPASAAAFAAELAGAAPEATTPTVPLPARPRRAPRRGALLVAGAAIAVAAAVGLAVVLTAGGGDGTGTQVSRPARVQPVPHVDDPAGQARALARWLRSHSR